MEKHERILWRIILALLITIILLFISAAVAALFHRPNCMFRLLLIAGIIYIPTHILSRIHDRISQKHIDDLKQVIKNLGMKPTQESDYEWLNREKLYMWTQEFDKLGFSRLGDYTMGIGGPIVKDDFLPQAFTRLMSNDKQKCFVEISQSKQPKTGLKEIACVITTIFTSGQQYKTSNEPASAAAAVNMMDKFGIKSFNLPGAAPEKLLLDHIEQRDQMATQQNLAVIDDVSFESYQQQTNKQMNQMKDWIKQKFSGNPNFDF